MRVQHWCVRVREPVRAWAASAWTLLIPLPADSSVILPELLQGDSSPTQPEIRQLSLHQ